jgi:hypothetical protein
MRIIAAFLFAFLTTCFYANAQADSTAQSQEPQLKYQAGAFAGSSQGLGMSFRLWPKKFGVQFTFAPTIRENSQWYSMGFSLLHWISRSEKTGLYVYQGNHLILDIDENVRLSGDSFGTQIQRDYFCGIGFGVQINIVTRFKVDFAAGFVAANNFQRLRGDIGMGLFYEF